MRVHCLLFAAMLAIKALAIARVAYVSPGMRCAGLHLRRPRPCNRTIRRTTSVGSVMCNTFLRPYNWR
jgi:hypothetical protein